MWRHGIPKRLLSVTEKHLKYWAEHGRDFHEIWRFEEGFRKGWEDAALFVRCGKSELGFRHRWMQHRSKEHEAEKGTSDNIWEYVTGFEQGYDGGYALLRP